MLLPGIQIIEVGSATAAGTEGTKGSKMMKRNLFGRSSWADQTDPSGGTHLGDGRRRLRSGGMDP